MGYAPLGQMWLVTKIQLVRAKVGVTKRRDRTGIGGGFSLGAVSGAGRAGFRGPGGRGRGRGAMAPNEKRVSVWLKPARVKLVELSGIEPLTS